MQLSDVQTPALLVDREALQHNIDTMSAALPGARLRPHVKAFKSTALARRLADNGHQGFTCATIREVEAMVAAGLDHDLLLANEVLDARRLGALVAEGSRVTVAVDSFETIEAALAGGVREVVIDVRVGMPRCGCAPEDAGRLATFARESGLEVRGVMGYEGHLMLVESEEERKAQTKKAMALLLQSSADVGGDLISAGGTGTYAVNTWAGEIQAGSFTLMDTAYEALEMPFRLALSILGTVISTSDEWAVLDVGLKALSLDHGLPRIVGAKVWFCADEHTTFSMETDELPKVGERMHVIPSHVDPTVALHDRMYLVDGEEVVEEWPIDMRGWR